MKGPVDPAALEAKHERNKHAIQAAFSALGLALIVSAFSFCIWLAWGSVNAIIAVGMFGGALSLLSGVVCIISMSIDIPRAIEFHNSYRWELNARDWDAQQEELARLRTIMKEEGL